MISRPPVKSCERRFRAVSPVWFLLCSLVLLGSSNLSAIQIAGYSPAVNDLFASGFTGTPIRNTNPSFVGGGYDFSALAWVNFPKDGGRVQTVTMISPLHAYGAAHYSPAVGETLRMVGSGGNLLERTVASEGPPAVPGATHDLNIVELTQPVLASEGVTPMRVLDIASGNPIGQPLFLVGTALGGYSTGQRMATGRVLSWNGASIFYIQTNTQDSSLSFRFAESGDSGSPVMIPYGGQLTVAGAFWFSQAAGSLLNRPSANYYPVKGVNELLAPDGYAMKFTIYDVPADSANTASVWSGAGNGLLNSSDNWNSGAGFTGMPVVFDAGGATALTAQTGGNQTIRGILFRAGTSTAGFQISGSHTLTIGETGIRSESAGVHTFSTPISLGGSQNWESAGLGELVFSGSISNNGHLLVVGGSGTTRILGGYLGTGGLAKDDAGTLVLSGSNPYTGKTFLHNGTLKAGSDRSLSAQSEIVFDAGNPAATLDIGTTTQNVKDIRSQGSGRGAVLVSGGTLSVGAGASGASTFSGSVAGTGSVIKTGAGTWRLDGDNGGYTGSFRVESGILRVGHDRAIGTGQQTTAALGSWIQTVSSVNVQGGIKFTAIQNGGSTMSGGQGGNALTAYGDSTTADFTNLLTLDRQGTGAGTLKYGFLASGTGDQIMRFSGGIATSGNSLGTVVLDATVQSTPQGILDFSGQITDLGGPVLQVYSVGVGTMLLSHSAGNTHRGGVAVWGATTVLVNNETGSGTGYGSVNFATANSAGSVLGGTGIIAPMGANGLTMGSGSTLSPGNGGTGVFTIDLAGSSGQARFLDGARFAFELGAESDLIAFTGMAAGDVAFTNNVINFDTLSDFAPGTYTLFHFDAVGAYSGTLQLGTGLEGYSASLLYAPDAVRLLVVPEPAASLLVLLGVASLVARRRARDGSR